VNRKIGRREGQKWGFEFVDLDGEIAARFEVVRMAGA